jgi:hypothetical protein
MAKRKGEQNKKDIDDGDFATTDYCFVFAKDTHPFFVDNPAFFHSPVNEILFVLLYLEMLSRIARSHPALYIQNALRAFVRY